MADPLKLATTTPVSTSSPMTTLGGQLGQALGGGLQQLAANRLQRLQQQQQVSGLANLIGGDQQLAANILSQSPEIQKQILGSGGFRTLAGQGLQQGQGLDLFTPVEKPMSEYQKQMLEYTKQQADLKQQKAEKKERTEFYEKNLSPLMTAQQDAFASNTRLASLREKADQVTSFDKFIEGLPEGAIKDYAILLQTDAAIGAKKDQASFIRGVNNVIKGKLTNYEAKIWLDQFPNILKTSVKSAKEVINSLIWVNNLLIQKAKFAEEIYQENPNITIDKFNSQLNAKVRNFLEQQPTIKKKNELTEQVAQEQTMQPVEPQEQPELIQTQPQEQPVTTQIQPQQPEVTPQEQPQPQQFTETQERQIEGYQRIFGVGREEAIRKLQQDPDFGLTAKEQELKTAETLAKPIIPAFKTATQVITPFITSFTDEISNILKNLGNGKIGQAAKIAEKIVPTTEKANDLLRAIGVSEEEIENPSLLVNTLKTLGIALPIGAAAKAKQLLPLLATLGANAIGTQLLSKGAGALGEAIAGEEGRQVGESTARLFGPTATQAGLRKIEERLRKYTPVEKAFNKVLKNAQNAKDLVERTEAINEEQLAQAENQILSNDEIIAQQYKDAKNIIDAQKQNEIPEEARANIVIKIKDLIKNEIEKLPKDRLREIEEKYKPSAKKRKGKKNIVTVKDAIDDSKILYEEMTKYRSSRLSEARNILQENIQNYAGEDYLNEVVPINQAFKANKQAEAAMDLKKSDARLANATAKTKSLSPLFQQARNIDKNYPKPKAGISVTDLTAALLSKNYYLGKLGLTKLTEKLTPSQRTLEALALLEEKAPELLIEAKKSMVDYILKPNKKTALAFQKANELINNNIASYMGKNKTETTEENQIEPILF